MTYQFLKLAMFWTQEWQTVHGYFLEVWMTGVLTKTVVCGSGITDIYVWPLAKWTMAGDHMRIAQKSITQIQNVNRIRNKAVKRGGINRELDGSLSPVWLRLCLSKSGLIPRYQVWFTVIPTSKHMLWPKTGISLFCNHLMITCQCQIFFLTH